MMNKPQNTMATRWISTSMVVIALSAGNAVADSARSIAVTDAEQIGVSLSLAELRTARQVDEDSLEEDAGPIDAISLRRPTERPASGDTDLGALLPTSTIVDTEVRTQADDNFGTIDALVLALDRQRVVYALIAHGGLLGMGETLYPVPLQKLRWLDGEDKYSLDITAEQLAPVQSVPRAVIPKSVRRKALVDFYAAFDLDANGEAQIDRR